MQWFAVWLWNSKHSYLNFSAGVSLSEDCSLGSGSVNGLVNCFIWIRKLKVKSTGFCLPSTLGVFSRVIRTEMSSEWALSRTFRAPAGLLFPLLVGETCPMSYSSQRSGVILWEEDFLFLPSGQLSISLVMYCAEFWSMFTFPVETTKLLFLYQQHVGVYFLIPARGKKKNILFFSGWDSPNLGRIVNLRTLSHRQTHQNDTELHVKGFCCGKRLYELT